MQSAKALGLVALLATSRGVRLHRDVLIDGLWNGEPPRTAASALRVHLGVVRAAFRSLGSEDLLVREGSAYCLHTDVRTDIEELESSLRRARAALGAGDDEAAKIAASRAVELHRGEPFGGLDLLALQVESERLADMALDAEELLAIASLRRQGAPGMVADLARLVAEQPLREQRTVILAEALYAEGRQVEALDALDRLRSRLREDLGLDPSQSVADLERAILTHDAVRLGRSNDLVAVGDTTATVVVAASAAAAAPKSAVERPPAGDARLAVMGGADFVGRNDEVEDFDFLLQALTRGSNQTGMAVVRGEPGMGKTWLLAKVAALAVGRGVDVAYGRSSASGFAPLEAWVEILWSIHNRRDHEMLVDRLAGLAPALARLCPGFAGVDAAEEPELDPEVQRSRLMEALVRVIEIESDIHPQLVVVDDLQWASPGTMGVLSHVLRRIPANRCLVLGAMRPVGGREASSDLRALSSRADTELIDLRRIEIEDAALIAAQDGREGPELDAEALQRLYRRSGGSPLHFRQLVRGVAPDGVLPFTDDLLQVPPDQAAAIAATEALAVVPTRTLHLLEDAAVVGVDVDLDVLATSTSRNVAEVAEGLEPALRRGVLSEDPISGDLSFSHVAYRDALYQGMSNGARRRRHMAIAETLRGRAASPAGIAYHSLEASPLADDRIVLDDAISAADWLLGRASHDGARDVLVRLLESPAATGFSSPDRAAVGSRLGRALMLCREIDGARAAWEQALGDAADGEDAPLFARIAIEYDDYGRNMSASTRRFEVLEEAQKQLETAVANPSLVLEVRAERINEGFFFGRTRVGDEADRLRDESAEVLDAAVRLGDDRTVVAALNARHMSLLSEPPPTTPTAQAQGHPPPREQPRLLLSRDMLTRSQRMSDPVWEGVALQCHVHDLLQDGLLEEARSHLGSMQLLAEKTQLPKIRWFALMIEAAFAYLEGEFEHGRRTDEEAMQLGQEYGLDDAFPAFLGARLSAALHRGGVAELIGDSETLLTFSPVPEWQVAHALCLAAAGDSAGARSLLDEVLAQFDTWPRNVLWQMNLGWTAELVSRVGADPGATASLARLLDGYAGRLIVVGAVVTVLGPADLYRALVARARGEDERAAALFREADALSRRLGVQMWIDRIDEERGR